MSSGVIGGTAELPAGVLEAAGSMCGAIARLTAAMGRAVVLDPDDVVWGRSVEGSEGRPGRGPGERSARIVATTSGWLAASLARPDDVELVPAWLCRWVDAESVMSDPWAVVERAALEATAAELVDAAAGLGLPVARVGECARILADGGDERDGGERDGDGGGGRGVGRGGVVARRVRGDGRPLDDLAGVRVVDLSALWAGPLCGAILAAAGAEVTKVELVGRPDALRDGPSAGLFAQLAAGKRHELVDHRTEAGRARLRELVSSADVVIEGSRPRALRHLGIDAEALLAVPGGPRAWVSITGFGRVEGDRVAFGDVAAAAGGLVAWDGGEPSWCGDAIADPLTGLAAAEAALDHLALGGRWLLDVSMAHVAALAARPRSLVGP